MKTNTCRTCKYAYIRIKQTSHYNYEACALGMQAMTPVLTGSCRLYERATVERIEAAAPYEGRSTIIWGEDYEIR